jgi:hypothetical protein
MTMFHKGKRRRRFTAFAQAEPEASSFDSLSELTRIATSFKPARYEPDEHQLETSADREEPRGVTASGGGVAPAHTVSEAPTGERVFYFGCYASATRFDLERKIATPAHSRQEGTHERTER